MPLLGNMMCRNVDKNLQVPEMYLPNLDAQLLTVWEEFTDEQRDFLYCKITVLILQ